MAHKNNGKIPREEEVTRVLVWCDCCVQVQVPVQVIYSICCCLLLVEKSLDILVEPKSLCMHRQIGVYKIDVDKERDVMKLEQEAVESKQTQTDPSGSNTLMFVCSF